MCQSNWSIADAASAAALAAGGSETLMARTETPRARRAAFTRAEAHGRFAVRSAAFGRARRDGRGAPRAASASGDAATRVAISLPDVRRERLRETE